MSQEPTITHVSLSDLSTASCAFARCRLLSQEHADCLVVAFEGEAGNSNEHVGTFRFMLAMIAAGVAAWSPSTLVLDLQKLKYAWGDQMGQVLGSHDLPTTVVGSELNRDGLTSLVEKELFAKASDWLFDSVADAVAGCERKYVACLRDSPTDRHTT